MLQAICLVPLVLLSVLVAGCVSEGPLRNVYLLSLEYQTVQIRIGYFTLCVAAQTSDWICGREVPIQSPPSSADPWNLVGFADRYRHQVVFAGLALTSAVLMLLLILAIATFPRWRTELDYNTEDGASQEPEERFVKPFPSRHVLIICLLVALLGALLSLVAAVWQHSSATSTATTIAFITRGEVRATIGAAATALVWLAFGVCLVVAVLLSNLCLSIAMFTSFVENLD
ncbi:Ca2+ regulator and membrane fusion protein Fig1-domain-containing protein [Podospora didyma]|uniref:Ca2+ regulator and membrane fusion protein Fig1-domain-containing protein n=1 Tax=Podospora didyma TaxID=330526 RepID=A0AAE0U239_9PEZI|nr:Ca2+ regulator and membrane fusion protein Fig1-domain-containing protein [Podospora didyma]